MAKVEYAFPVEKIHGKIAKNHKIGFAHRVASNLNYTQSYSKRSTAYSQDEIDHQTKFAAPFLHYFGIFFHFSTLKRPISEIKEVYLRKDYHHEQSSSI